MLTRLLLASVITALLLPVAIATAPNVPISVNLEVSTVPILGQEATIAMRVVSVIPARDASANITMSDQLQLVSGALSWRGTLAPGVEIRVIAVVKAVATGSAWIVATAGFPVSGGYFQDTDILYLDVGTDHSEMSHTPLSTTATMFQAQMIQKASEFPSNWLIVVLALLVALPVLAVLGRRGRTW
jgi:hypothetical protein